MNVLFLISDEHNAAMTGCFGHTMVQTPSIDALAQRGTRFTSAYTPSPICVPARASLATGRPVFEIGAWDNSHPYRGEPKSWAHRVRENGRNVVSIGKLHYRNEIDDTGFTCQIAPMHVVDGVGNVRGILRDPTLGGKRRSKIAEDIGPGESGYIRYDRNTVNEACRWLHEEARSSQKPWVLSVSLVCPHFPLIAPPQFYDLYDPYKVPLPQKPASGHPWMHELRKMRNDEDFFDEASKRVAIASYFALCTFMDDNIGKVLSALDQSGARDETLVIYTSDHGENLGNRELWGKNNMYEDSVRIPLVLSGPGVPEGKVCNTCVSLLDIYPTILAAADVPRNDSDPAYGADLRLIAVAADDPERAIFSEYHATGPRSGVSMVRKGRYKYIHYVGYPPELFDLAEDPSELRNLAPVSDHQEVLWNMRAILEGFCPPEKADRAAKASQAELIRAQGGKDAVIAKGAFQGTPAPGDKVEFVE